MAFVSMVHDASGLTKADPEDKFDMEAKGSYDFSAPQYYDFEQPSPKAAEEAEGWFEQIHSSVVGEETEEGRQDLAPPQDMPSSVSKTTGRSVRFDLSSPKGRPASLCTAANSPLIVVSKDSGSSADFFRPQSVSSQHSPVRACPPAYERLFQMTKRKKDPSLEGKSASPHITDPKEFSRLTKIRFAAPLPTKSTKPLTIPVEFNLSSRARQKPTEAKSVSAAAELAKSTAAPKKTVTPHQKPALTVPQSPMLLTKLRTKPTQKIPTVEEKILHEIEHGQQPFRARPVNKKILTRNGDFGVPKVAKPKTTVPIDFKLATAARSTVPKHEKVVSTSPFKATPIPVEIFRHPVGVPPKTDAKITVPQSPNISKKARAPPTVPTVEAPIVESFKARPAPNHDNPFRPKLEHHAIRPSPTVLPGDRIAEAKRQRFNEALAKERTELEKSRNFRARPLPNFQQKAGCDANTEQPELRAARPLTKPEPFNLQSQLRSSAYQEKWQERMHKEAAAQSSQRKFIARPPPPTHSAPFIPKKSTKFLTQHDDVFLHSTARAEKRREFNEFLQQKEADAQALARRYEAEHKKLEAEEIRRLRQELVPKAQPIRHYAPIQIKPSTRPLTVPQSPAFGALNRVHKRTQS